MAESDKIRHTLSWINVLPSTVKVCHLT